MRGRGHQRVVAASFAGIVAASVVLATLALGQPRRPPAGRPGAKPKGSASAANDNPYEGAPGAPSASASAGAPSPGASGSTTVVAAPPPASPSGGALSPLNPAANEFSDGGAPPAIIDYDRLLADVAALRARVAAVSDTMYRTKIAISLETSGDHGRIASLAVSIDDGIVWTSPPSFRAEDTTKIYEHSVAPGHHALTVEIERRDDRDDTYRSTQRSRFVVDVPNDQNLGVVVKLWDDSDIGGDFRSDHKGQYELRVRMRARAEAVGK
jgi:hypothetical protein